MKTIKTFLLSAALLLSGHAVADSYQFLSVSGSAETAQYEIAAIQSIKFPTEHQMALSLSNGQQVTIDLASVDKMFFSGSVPDGISAALQGDGGFTISGGELRLNGEGEAVVTVFSVDGKLLRRLHTSGGSASLSQAVPGNGAYIIKVEGTAQKVIIK